MNVCSGVLVPQTTCTTGDFTCDKHTEAKFDVLPRVKDFFDYDPSVVVTKRRQGALVR